MESIVTLLFLVAIWLFLAPFFILSRISALREKIDEFERQVQRQLAELRGGLPPAEPDAEPAAYEIAWGDPAPREAEEAAAPAEEPAAEAVWAAGAEPADAEPIAAAPELIAAEAADESAPDELPWEPEREEDVEPILSPEPLAEISRVREALGEFSGLGESRRFDQVGGAFSRALSWLLKEGNIWVCAGVLLFLLGFGLLFSYVMRRGFLTLEMRLVAGALAGIGMTGFGFRMRERRRAYGLILQGGGVGVLYLVVLAATKYSLLSTGQPILSPAFAVAAMLALSVFTVLLALLQDYQPLALFAILGGFAAPILVSTGSRNHVALFSIYSLLNFEILALTLKRDWRLLSRMGFVLSVAIGTAWGVRDWRPALFASVEPFLLIFLATYTAIAVLSVRKRDRAPDLFLAVTAPFSFFFLQTRTTGHLQYGMALTCLGLGLWHLLFGAWLRRGIAERESEDGSAAPQGTGLALSRLYMSLCIVFSNLVVAYTFENQTASAVWAVEGAFLIAAAWRRGSCKALLGGAVLHAGALVLCLHGMGGSGWRGLSFAGGALFALALLASGLCASRFRPLAGGPLYDAWEERLQRGLGQWDADGAWVRGAGSWAFTVLGALWWWGTIYSRDLGRFESAWITFFSISCLTALLGGWVSARLRWRAARFLLVCPIAVASLAIPHALFLSRAASPFTLLLWGYYDYIGPAALAYALFVGGALWLLRGAERSRTSAFTLFAALLSGLFLTRYAILEARFDSVWQFPLSILPLLGLMLLARRLPPLGLRPRSWREDAPDGDARAVAAASGLFLLSCAWGFLRSYASPGAGAWGTFIPILNPLELWQTGFLISLFLWIRQFALEGRPFGAWPRLPQWGFAVLFFAWFNQVAVRASWHYWGEASFYRFGETLRLAGCQALIALFWGVLGLGCVLGGQRARSRDLWRAGAGLIAADIVKLLLVDLRGAETLVRILAFLVLGGLSLLIGWVAPLPPKKTDPEEESHHEP